MAGRAHASWTGRSGGWGPVPSPRAPPVKREVASPPGTLRRGGPPTDPSRVVGGGAVEADYRRTGGARLTGPTR